MHELPLIKSVFQTTMDFAERNHATKVTAVYLSVGVLRDFVAHYLVEYWKYVTKGSIAEGSSIIIEDIPATIRCSKCGLVYPILKDRLTEAKCPRCGEEKGEMVNGRELFLDHIDIEQGDEQ